ncbi:MAG: hypothetical protein RLZZ241_552 [Bacteroidota bacterium]|jgi:hypothetical protein
MKIHQIILLLLFAVFSCDKADEPELNLNALEGTWLLVEALRDSKDGGRIFEPVTSSREITLLPNNTFTTNYDVCQAIEAGDKFSGDFERIGLKEFLIRCAGSLLNSVQGKIEDGHLILYYPCAIPCAYKFEKIADFKE